MKKKRTKEKIKAEFIFFTPFAKFNWEIKETRPDFVRAQTPFISKTNFIRQIAKNKQGRFKKILTLSPYPLRVTLFRGL